MQDYYVEHHAMGWAVRAGEAAPVLGYLSSRYEAVEHARKLAQKTWRERRCPARVHVADAPGWRVEWAFGREASGYREGLAPAPQRRAPVPR